MKRFWVVFNYNYMSRSEANAEVQKIKVEKINDF